MTLVTGGAGFIGSHVVARLRDTGRRVRVLDSFDPQVHRAPPSQPDDDLVVGDVCNVSVVEAALEDVTEVVHLAAAVGVGQSMYEIVAYSRTNVLGTARLLEALIDRRGSIRKLLVASSMSIYGEGAYECDGCALATVGIRPLDQLKAGRWDPRCEICGSVGRAVPTAESKRIDPTSIYAINKRDQEEMSLVFGRAYAIPSVALRFFNVYGPGQSLDNPYTGVGAIFASRLLKGLPPLVFEDGKQTRDFVHVDDVAAACLLALETDDADGLALNVGTGIRTSVAKLADLLREELGGPEPEFVGNYREGDIRHCFADTSLIRDRLGWASTVSVEDGIPVLAAWVRTMTSEEDLLDRAVEELQDRGLLR